MVVAARLVAVEQEGTIVRKGLKTDPVDWLLEELDQDLEQRRHIEGQKLK